MGLGQKIQQIGNPELIPMQNVFSMFCFFCFGLNFLVFYNAVVNIGDLLALEFGDYELDFMSTYPLFLNWFNFFFAFALVVLAIYVRRFPFNILIHVHFILYIVLFAITPIILNKVADDVTRFWVMIVITVCGGIPCQLSGGVITSLAGLFSSTHNTIYLVGSSAGGIIVSLLRIMSHRIFGDDKEHDYYLALWVNIVIVVDAYILYFVLYYMLPFTRKVIKKTQGEEVEEDEVEMKPKKKYNKMSKSSSDDPFGVSSESSSSESEDESDDSLIGQIKRVFRKTWVQLLTCAIDYFWTFCVFAGIFLKIPYDESSMSIGTAQQITTFCFMGGDFLARILALIPIPWNRWVVIVLAIARCLFYVVIFIFYYGVYTNPYLMFFVMVVFSTTHGLFASAAIGLCFQKALPKDMKMTANLCNLSLDLGLALGATGLFVLNLVLPSNQTEGSL